MTLDEACKIVLPELRAVTIDAWGPDDFEDDPELKTIVDDVGAGVFSPPVVAELLDRSNADWVRGRMKTAVFTVLAGHGALEEFDDEAVWSRRPITRMINGTRYIIG